jgi:hypothetical protein
MPEAICRYRGLSPGAKVIYARLCRFAGKGGSAYPAIGTLAKETGMSETQARGYLKELEKEHFIQVDRKNRHYRKDGSGGSNRYIFLWHPAFDGDSGAARKAPPPLRKSEGVPPRKTGPVTPAENRTRRESSSAESVKESQVPDSKSAFAPIRSRAAHTSERNNSPSLFKADDDEKPPRPRASGDTPRKEFLLRVAERHTAADGLAVLRLVQKELQQGHVPLTVFLERDARETTNPKAITNPPGYYRDLAKKLVNEQTATLQTGTPPDGAILEAPRCERCRGTGLMLGSVEGEPKFTSEYCVCQLGQDLKRQESRKTARSMNAEAPREPRQTQTAPPATGSE